MDRAVRRLLTLLFAVVLGALGQGAAPAMAQSETFEGRIAALAAHVTVVRPDGPGPFPTVVQLHGCGGRKAFQDTWAAAAREAGWAAAVVDSFAPRGIGQMEAYSLVCTGLTLWGRERAGDAYAALEWARRQPWADPDRLALAGWSHGGWTVLDALALRPAERARATGLSDLPAEPLAGLRGAFLLYPYAGRAARPAQRGWTAAPRTLAIVAGRDRIVGVAAPRRHLQALAAQGLPVETVLFETATHAFDEPGNRDLRVRHDPALTRRAERLYQALLRGAADHRSANPATAR